ncbi:glycoside hydrolase family 65 protein [Vagococcus fluvialis]|uniref:glycoside hydrolase family 65 protein n=1 Tax=Vagococcus fluvialis TaxID=2738 RepID=UPI003D1461DC
MNNNINYVNHWIIEETTFNPQWLGKYEAIMAQGNGYLGLRASTEESYTNETRNLFVAGTFNQFSKNEVTELPNIPDIINMELVIDGETLDLNRGTVLDYSRQIDYQTGELTRQFIWETTQKKQIRFEFRRNVSNIDLHFIKQEVRVTPLSGKTKIDVTSGINGRVTNSGSQHFIEWDKRKKEDILQMNLQTTESDVKVTVSTKHTFYLNDKPVLDKRDLQIFRRQIFETVTQLVDKDDTFIIEKTSSVFTSRDFDYLEDQSVEEVATKATQEINQTYAEFNQLIKEKWQATYQEAEVIIESKNVMDQLLLNFSRYHLMIMTHPYDNRVNIGAKGLSGEGYKGHTFWDTEIFILPYFTFCYPKIAKNLIEYRYQILPGARKKASDNGYLGAQIPWESAWISVGEVTPLYGDVDIITGTQTKILTGLIEDHVSSDVVYGITQYLKVTGEKESSIYRQLVLEIALFWTTRAEKNSLGIYEIKDVIGPDEYKEHVDNNTYTNTMAKFTVDLAIDILQVISEEEYKKIRSCLNNLNQIELLERLVDFSENLVIPTVNKKGILPQDDTYLDKKELDITNYKNHPLVNQIFKEYNLDQINERQVSKQADVLLLMTLFFEKFTPEEIIKNFDYYETRTVHDSSLSLSTHSILASLLGNTELAYDFFEKLITIDLGKNMHSSDQGIHSASMGGVWQSVVFGFGGLKYDMNHENLYIQPKLPKEWESLTYQFYYQGQKIEVFVGKDTFEVKNVSASKENVSFYYQGVQYNSGEKIKIIR